MRLCLDSGAADGEALNALSKLRENLRANGPDPHELVDALTSAGFALAEEAPLPPAPPLPPASPVPPVPPAAPSAPDPPAPPTAVVKLMAVADFADALSFSVPAL